MPFQASEVLPLIDEIERLQSDVKRLKEVVAGYCGSGQRIQDLSDDCGLLEESNKTLRAEVERLRARDTEWQQKSASWMETPEAAQRLDGYRGLAAKLAHAEAEVERLHKKCDDLTANGFQAKLKQLDEAKKEIERLRALLLDAFGDPESQPSIEAWGKLRREFGAKEGGA